MHWNSTRASRAILGRQQHLSQLGMKMCFSGVDLASQRGPAGIWMVRT